MIRGVHGLFYSADPAATRAFFKDQVKLPGSDIGEGWWIFDVPEGDLGVHPVEDPTDAGKHDVSFYCDDIHGTVADLKSRGVVFTKEVEDHGYGLVTYFTAPGGITVQLYEPRYVKSSTRIAARASKSQHTVKTKAKPVRHRAAKRATAKKRR
jgi:hypothetical protein